MVQFTPTLLLMTLVLKTATSQTFQYSRGWTNGKRSEDSSVLSKPESRMTDLPISNLEARAIEPLSAICRDIGCVSKKSAKFLRVNNEPQLCVVPCDHPGVRRRTASQEKQRDILPADGHYRRSFFSEYDSRNDNY